MATQIFTKDEQGNIREEWVQTNRVSAFLSNGWVVDPSDLEPKAPTFEEADTNDSGALSTDEVREAAKNAGIEGWDTKRIKTLKRELGYVTDED